MKARRTLSILIISVIIVLLSKIIDFEYNLSRYLDVCIFSSSLAVSLRYEQKLYNNGGYEKVMKKFDDGM